jgi:membrane protease YdiL (CAAX protease family)
MEPVEGQDAGDLQSGTLKDEACHPTDEIAGFAITASTGFDFMSEKAEGEIDRWGDISGNVKMYLLLLALSVVSAGFAEEMFFRGYLISRVQAIFGSSLWATVLSIFLPALLFGYVHIYYQGLQGFVNAGVIGVIFGTLFLKFKRNLWPLILAHAFINCLGYTAEFMGWEI